MRNGHTIGRFTITPHPVQYAGIQMWRGQSEPLQASELEMVGTVFAEGQTFDLRVGKQKLRYRVENAQVLKRFVTACEALQ